MFFVGIAGGSGSGKTYLSRAIAASLPAGSASVIAVDSYYRAQDHLSLETRAAQNYDHPNSLELDLLADHLAALRRGETVAVPNYDFCTHTRGANATTTPPADWIIVEGILTFHLAAVRSALDFRIFVDTAPDLSLSRRVTRDIAERGRTEASVLRQWQATVFPMYLDYCLPTKKFADIVWNGAEESRTAMAHIQSVLFDQVRSKKVTDRGTAAHA